MMASQCKTRWWWWGRGDGPADTPLSYDDMPLCVFGPGGEYRTALLPGPNRGRGGRGCELRRVSLLPWPRQWSIVPCGVSAWWSALASVLTGSRRERNDAAHLRGMSQADLLPLLVRGGLGLYRYLERNDEPTKNSQVRSQGTSDTEATRDPLLCSRRASVSRLFPDATGNRRRSRHKQNHGIRTRRNAYRQRHAHASGEQGTLFGADFCGEVSR